MLLAIADGLVTSLATAFPTVEIDSIDVPITVAWTENPRIELEDADLLEPLVWVVDWSETLESVGGYSAETFDVLIVVQMKQRAGDVDATFVRTMSGLVANMVRHMRSRDSSLEIADAVCIRVVRKNGKNSEDWNSRGRFYAEILTTWQMC